MTNSRLDSGMGLIETLIILLLVSIGVVSLIKYQHFLSYNDNTLQQQFDATILASKQMETLRDFQVLTTTAGYTAYADIGSGSSSQIVGNTSYTITYTVTTNASPPYKTINVVVSWTDRNNSSRSVTVSSQVAGVDPGQQASIK